MSFVSTNIDRYNEKEVTSNIIDISNRKYFGEISHYTFEHILIEKLNEIFVELREEAAGKERIYPTCRFPLIGHWSELESGLHCFLPVIAKHLSQDENNQPANHVASAREELRSYNLKLTDLFPKLFLVPQIPSDQTSNTQNN